MRPLAVALVVACLAPGVLQTPARSSEGALYDADPNHPWNRIHDLLHVRTAADGVRHGFDTVDPLLWRETRYLVSGPSHAAALDALDQFLAGNGERLVADPVKRAVFQNDLWAVFDWLASGSDGPLEARTELEKRIARILRRVALSRKQIEALPDTYAEAVAAHVPVPPDLFDRAGPWVSIGGGDPVTPQHAALLGRSAFTVFWSVPGGAAATSAYLRKLWDFPQPYVIEPRVDDGEVRVMVNPALPPVPDGTRLALVRQMLLIDDSGAIVPSTLLQSVQMRTIPASFADFQYRRQTLFNRQGGGLKALTPDDQEFLTFSAMGEDFFELRPVPGGVPRRVLEGCRNCHDVAHQPPIETILSLRRTLKPWSRVDSRHERWARWITQPSVAASAKGRTYTWGVLEGFWQNLPR